MHVGLPCMKLSLSPSTQKHNGKKAATCSVKSAWDEMRDIRRGRDETIDRSMTDQNIWLRGSTDMDMEVEIQKYIDQVNADKKAHGKRSLRCDAVTGIEMIEKPPLDYMEKLSKDEQFHFLKASSDVIDQILKEWNPDWITAAQVIHFDEFGGKSPHSHRIIVPITKDKEGILTFNAKAEFNLKFFTFVNTEYPKRMREQGYDIEDCKIYDRMTEEEKEEHRQNKPEYGLSSFEYKRKKQQELDERIADRETIIQQQGDKIREQISEQVQLRSAINKQTAMIADNEKEISQQEQILSEKAQEITTQEERQASKEEYLHQLDNAISEKGAEVNALEDRYDELTSQADALEKKNRQTNIRIMTQKEVDTLPEPPKTFGGDYKVSPKNYRNLVATAKRVGMVSQQETNLQKREQKLREDEAALEKKRRLSIKEQMELSSLRKLKGVVEKVVAMLPESWIKEVLQAALTGRDLIEEQQRQRARTKSIDREAI